MSDYKTCTRCGEMKLPELFRWDSSRGSHRARCLSCDRAADVARKRSMGGPARARGGVSAKWTEAEDDVIRALYPEGGAARVHAEIPSRTLKAIFRRAGQIGVESYRSLGADDKRIHRETLWAIPQHDYTPADFAIRQWRSVRPVIGVFAPSLGISA